MKAKAKFDQRLFRSLRDAFDQRLRVAAERGEESSVQPLTLWVVASWIHEGCTRPISWDKVYHWGESPEHRRRRGGYDWLLFSSKACAEATLLSVRTTQLAVRELIRLGLVESYLETTRPRQIRQQDRYRLLTYWRDQPDRATWADRDAPRLAIVRILLEDGMDWSSSPSTCKRLGNELIFPTSLVTQDGARLHCVIARTLALVLRDATRRHWGLILERMEDPFERWRKRRGRTTAVDLPAQATAVDLPAQDTGSQAPGSPAVAAWHPRPEPP